MKPDNLNPSILGAGLKEDDWHDVFVAYAPTKNISVTAAYAGLGRIVPAIRPRTQAGFYTDQRCALSSGPCQCGGLDMKKAHQGMGVRTSHFNALVEVLQQSMDAKKIPFTVQNRMLALLAPMHRDIITT